MASLSFWRGKRNLHGHAGHGTAPITVARQATDGAHFLEVFVKESIDHVRQVWAQPLDVFGGRLGMPQLLGTCGFVSMVLATERSAVNWAFLHPAGAIQSSYLAFDGLWRQLSTSSLGT